MVVLDTSFLVAYRNDRDVHHRAASELYPQISAGDWGPALLPEYVFLETVNVVHARRGFAHAVEFGRQLLDAIDLEFVACSPLVAPAFEAFRSQRGTDLGLTDSAIVAIARRRQDPRVATFDKEFRKVEGLDVLPA